MVILVIVLNFLCIAALVQKYFLKFSIPKCYNTQINNQCQSINTTFILYTKVYMSEQHVST